MAATRLPQDEWRVVVKDRYPAYIDWQTFERIQAMLRDNYAEYLRHGTRGTPRDGAALLQGIAWCGECGHKLVVQYCNGNRYACTYLQHTQGAPMCQHLPADPIDARVVAAFFEAVAPAELDAWEQAQAARHDAAEALDRAEAQQVERLRYQALLAGRQFNRVDPDNRLVAAELERRWEAALRDLRQAEEALARRRAANAQTLCLTAAERADFCALAPRLPELWRQPGVTRAHRKALLRCLIDKVVMRRSTRDCVQLRIVWRGGATTEMEVGIAVGALTSLARGAEMEARVLDLARAGTEDAAIAALLTEEGFRSPRHSQVLVNTIRAIRLRHRVLQAPSHPRRLAGWLTVSQLAQRLGIPRRWIDQRIRSGTIVVGPHPPVRLHLFPDTEAAIAGFRNLRAGRDRPLALRPPRRETGASTCMILGAVAGERGHAPATWSSRGPAWAPSSASLSVSAAGDDLGRCRRPRRDAAFATTGACACRASRPATRPRRTASAPCCPPADAWARRRRDRRLLRPRLWHLQRRGPAAEGRMVRHAQRQPEQADDGADQPLGLAVGQAEHGPERQRRQDGQRRVPGLPAPGRAWFSRPRFDRLVGEPDRQAAALPQAGVIRRPVRDLVRLSRDVTAAVLVQLEGQGGHPGSAREHSPTTPGAPSPTSRPIRAPRCFGAIAAPCGRRRGPLRAAALALRPAPPGGRPAQPPQPVGP